MNPVAHRRLPWLLVCFLASWAHLAAAAAGSIVLAVVFQTQRFSASSTVGYLALSGCVATVIGSASFPVVWFLLRHRPGRIRYTFFNYVAGTGIVIGMTGGVPVSVVSAPLALIFMAVVLCALHASTWKRKMTARFAATI